MPISDELKRVYSVAPVDDYYIETLSLEHPNIPGGVRYITNQLQGWYGRLETGEVARFDFLPFAALPPKSADDGNFSLQVAIDNADRDLMSALEALAEAPTSAIVVKFRVYLASDSETVQNDPPMKLDILGITATQATIAFNAGLANLRQRPFPSMLYTTAFYPGLAR